MEPLVLFLDNGAYMVKAMLLRGVTPSTSPAETRSPTASFYAVPNVVGRSPHNSSLVGSAVSRLNDYHGLLLRRPCTRRGGFLCDGLPEVAVWESILEYFSIGEAEEERVQLYLTVPFGAPKAMATLLCRLLLEHFAFETVTVVSSSYCAMIAAAHSSSSGGSSSSSSTAAGCGVVIDVGYSATTVVPYIDYLPVYTSIVRVDVGGKLLTNRLKEYLSYTQVNVMCDEWLVNRVKEVYGKVSLSFSDTTARGNVERYFLPTVPSMLPLGKTEEELEAILQPALLASDSATSGMASSDTTSPSDLRTLPQLSIDDTIRYGIPELLFTPGDVGIPQCGVIEAAGHAIFKRGMLSDMPLFSRELLSTVVVYGGSSCFPHLHQRLHEGLSSYSHSPIHMPICDTSILTGLHHQVPSHALVPLLGAYHLLTHPRWALHHTALRTHATIRLHKRTTSAEDIAVLLQHVW